MTLSYRSHSAYYSFQSVLWILGLLILVPVHILLIMGMVSYYAHHPYRPPDGLPISALKDKGTLNILSTFTNRPMSIGYIETIYTRAEWQVDSKHTLFPLSKVYNLIGCTGLHDHQQARKFLYPHILAHIW